MAPGGHELDKPEIPVADEGFQFRGLGAEVAVFDGYSEGALELLFAFCVPACEEGFVGGSVVVGGAKDERETPGEGYGVAEAGGDALAADYERALVSILTVHRRPGRGFTRREDMGGIAAEDGAAEGPFVAGAGGEEEGARAEVFDTVEGPRYVVG